MNRFSKRIVALVILLNVAFTGAVLYLFLRTGSEPTVLIGCWFAFTTGELWMLAGIRKAKLKEGEKGEP
jgi:threonine/homoserine efflux transporter RhtA